MTRELKRQKAAPKRPVSISTILAPVAGILPRVKGKAVPNHSRANRLISWPAKCGRNSSPPSRATQTGDLEKAFHDLKETFADDMDLSRFEQAIDRTFADFGTGWTVSGTRT